MDKELLLKDERWSIFHNTQTDSDFQKNIVPEFSLKSGVPQDVQDNFKIIVKLLQFSYFEYEFITIALKQSVFTFELALHKKYKEINKKDFKGVLEKLIKWFVDNKYYSEKELHLLDSIKYFRNHYAHPKMYEVSSPSFIEIIKEICQLINRLYS